MLVRLRACHLICVVSAMKRACLHCQEVEYISKSVVRDDADRDVQH
jgi:hypothetical protein